MKKKSKKSFAGRVAKSEKWQKGCDSLYTAPCGNRTQWSLGKPTPAEHFSYVTRA